MALLQPNPHLQPVPAVASESRAQRRVRCHRETRALRERSQAAPAVIRHSRSDSSLVSPVFYTFLRAGLTPFADPSPASRGSSMNRPPRGSPSQRGGRGHSRGGPPGGASTNRDKFVHLDRHEMPTPIPAWEDALKAVDRTIVRQGWSPSDGRYIMPEPALVVSTDDPRRRQLYLHHLSMMMDALVYRLGDPEDPHRLLSSQQWRDLLVGKAAAPQTGPTKAAARSVGIHEILGSAFRACGLTDCPDFPATPDSFPPITLPRAREILWLVGETNFRYEFLALDRRASGLNRPDECRECFAGGMLMGMPLALAKEGLASMSRATRHPFVLRIAKLMRKWEPRPRSTAIAQAQDREQWGDDEMKELERGVAIHYTQTFYHYFGRAAVVPTRLVHEFGWAAVVPQPLRL